MNEPAFVDVRKIPVRDGDVLEISMTQEFIDLLRRHFELSSDQPVIDDHVRMYLFGAVGGAVDRAEREMHDARQARDVVGVRQPSHREEGAGS
jgi:hypothetical protein